MSLVVSKCDTYAETPQSNNTNEKKIIIKFDLTLLNIHKNKMIQNKTKKIFPLRLETTSIRQI